MPDILMDVFPMDAPAMDPGGHAAPWIVLSSVRFRDIMRAMFREQPETSKGADQMGGTRLSTAPRWHVLASGHPPLAPFSTISHVYAHRLDPSMSRRVDPRHRSIILPLVHARRFTRRPPRTRGGPTNEPGPGGAIRRGRRGQWCHEGGCPPPASSPRCIAATARTGRGRRARVPSDTLAVAPGASPEPAPAPSRPARMVVATTTLGRSQRSLPSAPVAPSASSLAGEPG